MKKIYRYLCLLMCAVLLLSAVPAFAADTAPTLYFTNPTVTAGSTSSSYCYLQMKNAENISAMDYIIVYDADNLELTNIYNTGFTSQSDVTVSVNSSEPGIIRVTLISQNGLNGSGYLNLMYFRATKDAKPGTYGITVLVNDIFDSSLESVYAVTQTGTVTVKEGTQTVKNVNFSNSVSASSLKVGESFDYRLSASSLNTLSAGAFDFEYDAGKLKFDGVTLSSTMESTVYDVNSSVNGLVKVSFASENAITSGSNLVTLKFTATNAGTAEISFEPTDLFDYEFNSMTGTRCSKSVTVTEPEIAVDYSDLKISVPSDLTSDREFTVYAVLEGGSGVRAGDFTLSYDTEVVDCLGVSAQTVSNAWVVTDKNYGGGKVRFSLMSNADFADDTALVSVTFKAVANEDADTELTVSGTGVYSAEFEAVTLEYIGADIELIRPEYTVNFYDADGETLLFTQSVMSGNSAIPPKVAEIVKHDKQNHKRFDGWDKDYSVITDNTDISALYKNEAHTEIGMSDIEPDYGVAGYKGGTYCYVCETVITEPEEIPPLVHVSGVALDRSEVRLAIGESVDLVATVAPDNASNKAVTWKSSNTAVAEVTDGKVVAKTAGVAIITVTAADGGHEASCNITVYRSTFKVSGNIKSFGDNTEVTAELVKDGTSVSGSIVGNTYSFENVQAGTYTLRFSKSKHCPREYEVIVTDADVTLSVEIWLYGDVTADGVINHIDVLQINRKIAYLGSIFDSGTEDVQDYRFKVANITALTMSDTVLNHIDVLQINRKIAMLSSIFDSLT